MVLRHLGSLGIALRVFGCMAMDPRRSESLDPESSSPLPLLRLQAFSKHLSEP